MRLRIVQFSEEMTAQTFKTLIQYVLTILPSPIRMVQTNNDTTFTHS